MKYLLPLLFLCIAVVSSAQTGTIKGTVKTSDGQEAAFVSIALKENGKGTYANARGEYEIKQVQAGNYTLTASFMGLETQERTVEVKAGETIQVDFVLKENAQQLQEVVISSGNNKYKIGNPSSTLRIQTPLLETPQNIQVISKELLNNQQAFDMLEGVQRNVSGAQKVEHWDNYARINMRGSQLTAFRNGMNVQMPWGPLTEDMSMVDRIEFVKGPAGFMLASGEPSGFYNVVTKKPGGSEKGEISFSLGSFDTYRTTGDVEGRLTKNEKLLYRLNVMGQLKGSHRDYEYNNRYSITPVIKYLVDEKSALTLEYTHQYSEMSVIGSNYAFSNRKYADLPVNFSTAEPNLEPSRINDKSMLALFEHQLNNQFRLTAQAAYFNYNQVGQSLWPEPIETNDSLMQRGISIWDALGISKNAQLFLNGKFSTGRITHTLLAGADMSHKDYYADWSQGARLGDSTFNIYKPKYGTVPASELPQWDRTKSVRERGVRYNSSYSALYIQDELGFFNNTLRLTLAGRYTANKSADPYGGDNNDNKFTPRVGLSYSITKNTSLYAVYDEAFLANPGTDWKGNTFDPVTGENLEGGIKKEWFGGKWNSVLSVFRITKNNVLTTDLEHPDPVTGQFIFSRQTGQQQVKGVEFDLMGQLADNLQVVFNYAYTDARVTKDSNPEVVGNQVAGATKHLQNTWLNYTIGGGTFKGINFSLGYQYQAGRSSWFIFDNTENALPDYFRIDGAVAYHKDKFNIHLNVNNILNEYLYSGAPYYGDFYWQTEAPRNVRLTVAYRF